jgi:hypothetical protein
VEAENKEYSDEMNSGGDLSFDRANTANQKHNLIEFENQDGDNAEI